jgi:hypothetical protein
MACGGCARRKALLMKAAKAARGFIRKTPQMARDAIRRRVEAREVKRDGV